MSTNKNNKEEEVDLGSLFLIIGKGFKKLFNFIESLFKGFFHYIISILLFVKFHFIKFLIATLIGGGIGLYLELSKENTFGSNLLVQPNFNSTQQLYNNINYYNDLVKQKKTSLLASIFQIDTTEAATLKKFKITPIITDNDIINSYNNFILSVDTLTVKSYDFEQFKESFTDYDYSIHTIEVEATVNDIFSGLDEVIIASLVNNNYFDRIKKLKNEQYFRTDSLLRVNLIEVDSLRQVYMSVMLEEAKKSSIGTSIDLGGSQKTTKEIELFETDRRINNEIKNTSEEIAQKSEVINIISNFQSIGYEIKGVTKNYVFIMSALSVLMTLFFILILELNKYLTNYKKD
tara:strand:- start:23489 stop:24529 length:1041 start_codon:yes stop_codon:yes gene_type:complete